ncbi:MAG TPA: DUF2784 domain-containing protein [Bryobacteraceae bacterium]|nr:DUF2784 domain-containing protein [Bryobacteraceae bacterium]
MNPFAVLAAAVLVVHLVWIAWVLFGWLLTGRRRWLRGAHMVSLFWAALVELEPWPCPLTILEQRLLARAGEVSYRGSFIVHYLETFLYPNLPAWLLTWFGPAVCAAIFAIDLGQFWRERRA